MSLDLASAGTSLLGAGGFDPLSAGISFGVNALTGIASGQKVDRALSESLPIVGGIFKAAHANKDKKAAELEAAITAKNEDASFGQMHGSNMPLAFGGELSMSNNVNTLNNVAKFETGGSHEENPLGGIPIGTDSVEEGEVKFKFPEGDYVFSDRLIYYANK